MRSLSVAVLSITLAVIGSQKVCAQWVAYNDHAPGPGTSANATTYDVFGAGVGSTGPLKDIKTGATLPVTLTITTTASGVTPAGTQGAPALGTALYDAFNTYVDFQGTPSPSIELTPGGVVTYTFTGLNPNKRYRFMGSAVRGVATYTDRWTLFEIAGAASFTGAHTKNVLTNAVVPSISPNQAAINTGVNFTADTGDMVVWENIDPGPEGTFEVNCQQYTLTVPNGSSAGSKGYGMTGIRLEEIDVVGSPVAILVPPQSQTAQESQLVTFNVTATGNPPPTFQWFKDNVAIDGATGSSYTIPAVPFADDGAVFKVVASNRANGVDYSVTSGDAKLTVTPDTVAPMLLDVQAVGFNQVKLIFSERVTAATATNIQNYAIMSADGTVTISGIALDTNQTTVLINVSQLTEGLAYTLSVSGIRDQSGLGNLISSTQRNFSAVTYAPLDIGAPLRPGGVSAAPPDGYDVSGAGSDIAGTRDQFHFGYQQKTGDFDMRVRVADLTISDAYVKAGLMLRESLQDNARFAAIFASSAQLGVFFESRSSAGGNAAMSAPALKFPANYPWTWLRLRRVGNDFTGFGSLDGNAWQPLGAINMAVTNAYFGMAVTSSATNAIATAKFRNISEVQNPSAFTYRPEHESIGPANRRTGLIFSEIMYASKLRSDGRSMDFVEIYNSEPIFIDMTGWKIAGGIDYNFPDGFLLGAGQFVVIAADPDAIQESYGISGVLGPYQRQLSGTQDTLRLLNAAGAVRDELTYSAETPWPALASGAGHSLVCKNPSYGEDDPRAWGASELIGGSPGYDDPIVPNPWKGVVINEILALGSVSEPAFVELYNASNATVDLSGCFLTDSPTQNKFRIPDLTRIEARSWVGFPAQQLGFSLSSAGGAVYLVSADQRRVLDAVHFDGQEAGVSIGRSLDSSRTMGRLQSPTPNLRNDSQRNDEIVINEIMYNPISGNSEDEYIELYNTAATPVNLGGWRFTAGIDFVFPVGATIAGNGYVVVAKDAARMRTNYAQLNATNTFGNFDGQLKGSGERVVLAKPGMTASEFITICEVSYRVGGRWHDLANGGGSSLELKDPYADPMFAPNWAASDESQKAQWGSYEVTAPLNLANQTYAANKFFIMAQGPGEYLVDDVEVVGAAGTNFVANPGFENAQSPWTFFGTHRPSVIQTGGAFSGNACLDVRALENGDEGPNSIRGNLLATLTASATYTLRAKLRWISGWPEILLRIRGNGVELPVKLKIPNNLGTPGLANSRRVANAGPAITEVTHYPPLPAANEAVVVKARVDDPDGVQGVQLVWRLDGSSTFTTVPMRDDGTGGDDLAGDGIFSATLPPRASGLIAFHVEAQDFAAASASSAFPDDAPKRECLVRWADPVPFGSFGHYHLWATTASANDLTSRPAQDRSFRDCTIVCDMRVIYNAGWRNKGSPFHSGVGSYSTGYPDDDRFLGSDKHVLRSTGNGGDESTEMADAMAYWVGGQLGLPFNNTRYVRVYRNGTLHYRIDYDMEVPDRSIAKDWFGGGGVNDTLYKIAGWFEYDDSNGNGPSSLIWATLQKKPATAPPFKTGAYRFNWASHPGGKTANDYSLIVNLAAAANASDKITQLMNLADMEEWMRTFAHRRAIGDWDSWSYDTGQNMYLYAPLGERARLMSWDMDFVLGLGRGSSEANLFAAGEDPAIAALFNVPAYRRMLCRAYLDAANGPFVKATSDGQFDARRAALLKNNITAVAPSTAKSFVAARRTFLLSQIRAIDAAAFTVTTPDTTTASPTATITGVAPVAVASIEVNGVPYPVSWTTLTSWNLKIPLGSVTNVLQIVGKDLRGNVYTNATAQITFIYTGAIPQASDWVVINEIMYNAAATDAEYIEIYNRHPTFAFDLSGYQLKGADFTFKPGTLIQPNGYLVVAKDSAYFAAAYGATIPLAGEYAGRLRNDEETLTLIKPGAVAAQDVIVDEVHYESVFPWPETANGFGPSLQRIDAAQDSWRAGNWSVTATNDLNRATPGRANVNRSAIDPFPQLWINEILAVNQNGATDGAGEREPWIEIYNSGAEAVDLSLYYLSDDPTNPLAWQFPFGTTIGAGEFLVVWADGEPQQATATELHSNFRLSAAGGVVGLSRIQLGAAANVDYAYYPGLTVDRSFGSIADGDTTTRRLLFLPTPGGPNNPGELIVPVSINEWMPGNVRILADPADSQFEDWFELYNRGTSAVDLSGYFLSDSATNATKFQIPFGYTIPAGGFLLVWADDETVQNKSTNIDLHVNFKLDKDGDSIALFTPNGALLDAVTFTALLDNVSGGRYPDGSASIFTFPTATPRAANVAPTGTRFTRIAWDGAQLNIGWRTTAGRTYRLESTTNIGQPAWSPVGADITASTTTITINVDPGIANRFFRVVQVN